MSSKKNTVNGVTVIEGVPLISIADITPFERNPREHPEEQIKTLASWILEVGFIVPVLLDKNNGLIEGHGRLLAAKSLNMDKIPALHAAHLSEKQVRAHVLAGNKLASLATWDPLNLNHLLEQVRIDYDASAIGFSDDDIRRLSDDVSRLALSANYDEDNDSAEESINDNESEARSERSARDRGQTNADGAEIVPFSVMFTVAERAEVYDAIRLVKERDALTNSSEALLTIIREWVR